MKRIRWILAVVVAGAALSWLAYKNISDRRAESQQKQAAQAALERQNEVRSRIADFARKYNAVTNWQQRLDGTLVFSVDVEEALIDQTNSPVLFLGIVDDMVRRDGKNYLHFQNWNTAGPDIQWVLESTDKLSTTIRQHTKETFPVYVYAVVARISSIKKTSTETEDMDATANPLLTESQRISMSSRTFVATGQCVDVLTLGDDALDISWP